MHRLTNFRTIINIARECESIMPAYHTDVGVLNSTEGSKITYHAYYVKPYNVNHFPPFSWTHHRQVCGLVYVTKTRGFFFSGKCKIQFPFRHLYCPLVQPFKEKKNNRSSLLGPRRQCPYIEAILFLWRFRKLGH